MPVSSCVKEFSSLPINKGGLGIPSFADQYRKLLLAKRAALKNSSQPGNSANMVGYHGA